MERERGRKQRREKSSLADVREFEISARAQSIRLENGKTKSPELRIKKNFRLATLLFFFFFFVRRRDFDTRVAWTSTVIV